MKWGISPAACQVDPEVSSSFSISIVSVPALVGEEVEQADAHGAAADDRYSDLFSHTRPPANPACVWNSLHTVNCGLYGNR